MKDHRHTHSTFSIISHNQRDLVLFITELQPIPLSKYCCPTIMTEKKASFLFCITEQYCNKFNLKLNHSSIHWFIQWCRKLCPKNKCMSCNSQNEMMKTPQSHPCLSGLIWEWTAPTYSSTLTVALEIPIHYHGRKPIQDNQIQITLGHIVEIPIHISKTFLPPCSLRFIH